MGVTIHQRLGQHKSDVPATLDRAEKLAEAIKTGQADKAGIAFEIKRYSPTELFINIGGCETLVFNFKTFNEFKEEQEKEGWSYQHETLKDDVPKSWLEDDERLFTSEFCKTQFASSVVEHMWVAEIVRKVASYCLYAQVSDEGDYYYTGQIDDATKAIGENGAMIDGLTGMLEGAGFGKVNIIKGETKIKPRKKGKK